MIRFPNDTRKIGAIWAQIAKSLFAGMTPLAFGATHSAGLQSDCYICIIRFATQAALPFERKKKKCLLCTR